MRLNKYLSDCGLCSRRKADELIAEGAVTVDGTTATLGESVDPQQQVVAVRGRRVKLDANERTTIVLNKPRGIVTTMSDDRGRKTVAHFLPAGRRLFPVGRLDVETTGVLLCTTDGDLARVLTHPSFGVEKRYRVRTDGAPSAEQANALGAGAVRRHPGGACSFDIVLREGKNRQVRRMCAQQGLRVVELTRVQFGPVELRGLAPGKTRALTAKEKAALNRIQNAKLEQRVKIKRGRPTGSQNEAATS